MLLKHVLTCHCFFCHCWNYALDWALDWVQGTFKVGHLLPRVMVSTLHCHGPDTPVRSSVICSSTGTSVAGQSPTHYQHFLCKRNTVFQGRKRNLNYVHNESVELHVVALVVGAELDDKGDHIQTFALCCGGLSGCTCLDCPQGQGNDIGHL